MTNYLKKTNIKLFPIFKFRFINCIKSFGLIFITIIAAVLFTGSYNVYLGSDTNINYQKSLYVFLGYGFLINAFMVSYFISMTNIVPERFSDLQSRIALLGIKKIGYLIIVFFVALCFTVFGDIITTLIFAIRMSVQNVSLLYLFNWRLIIFLVASIFLILFFLALILLVSTLFPSIKSINLAMTLFIIPIEILLIFSRTFITLGSFDEAKCYELFLSSKASIYYLIFLISTIILSIIMCIIFEKFYHWKK